MQNNLPATQTIGFKARLALIAWLAMVGFDFFLRAGLLAPVYQTPTAFLLPPEKAFQLIPLGYLAFMGLSVMLTWLMTAQYLSGWQRGLKFGLQLGALAWGSLILGLYSIANAPSILLISWFLGQTIELGLAGVIVGLGLQTGKLRPLFWRVLIFMLVCITGGVIWQNLLP